MGFWVAFLCATGFASVSSVLSGNRWAARQRFAFLCWKPSKTDQAWTGNQPHGMRIWHGSETSKPPSPNLAADKGLPEGFYSATPLIPQNALEKPIWHTKKQVKTDENSATQPRSIKNSYCGNIYLPPCRLCRRSSAKESTTMAERHRRTQRLDEEKFEICGGSVNACEQKMV